MKRQEVYRRTVSFQGEGIYDLIEKADAISKQNSQSLNQFIVDAVIKHVKSFEPEINDTKQTQHLCACGRIATMIFLNRIDDTWNRSCKPCFNIKHSKTASSWREIKPKEVNA